MDIFSGLLNNYIFWVMLIFITLFEFCIIFFLNKYFNCYAFGGLTAQQWGLSLLMAVTVIPLTFIIRLLPICKPEKQEDVNDLANDLEFRQP